MQVLFTSRGGGAPFDELLEQSDVLSIHAPLSAATRHAFGPAELLRMKRGALLINTSRGPIVDEAAMVAALEAGHLGGAGLDVFEHEPQVHPGLINRDDVVILPHLGSATRQARQGLLVPDGAVVLPQAHGPRQVSGCFVPAPQLGLGPASLLP